ncbi:putative endo/exonuclease Mre11 [Leptomonas pyrrhocoris]|uniref:Putative endo/exonuclease Mre11 n=1 Tax=Leptomonas pyrrhocoris TaxID=157538 RepID=A0A0N0DYM3_LEPPY|nr:putative endo/exonuclease Mre11 [Leptomonas pyrrhocoris]XP_015662731.1 putative endo/exonuclease Mre11 [Leptomonas pyrrhocoris]KPA84291.1 putative endo/exonuclease Mre11 [Leptomonas pyrrhocoris]KPA84292.1 putative endo/exonuclease Mre11 [Leptomonas pyrrhocoris]|eukprot:XP_015662730.1 putative endo/exonuclease Mre11 [Leptomonas pyrrhocoris]
MTDSTFKILLTTDNHLGFAERDARRGDDSFTTFEEVLRAARTEHDVDLLLLGGDLFHENKPSLGCLVRSCSLFRKYVYGNKAIAFSLLSDPAVNFPTHALPLANFQDPNINVALPVLAIHGNHDDPVGGTSSLDLLATNGYLNYFGHVSSLEDIVVEPVLLRKGGTFIALYGLGNVRDERLHRCFRLKKVQFVYPKPVPGRKWFNILVLHQNRGVRGVASKNGILEGMLAGFGMDLVIWGNEHEQLMVPQPSDGFDVVQPGSTVLTSLSALECNPKQYGILEVRGTSYRLTPYTLRSVRPVVRRTVELREDVPDGRTLDAVETFLHGVMADMIREAEEQVARIPDDVLRFHPNLKYPLIRLAVDFSDVASAPYPQPNFNRFGQQYMDVVANPGELLRPVKPKPERRAPGAVLGPGGAGTGGVVVPTAPQLNTLDIRVKVAEVFNHNAKNACTLLSESELSAAVYAFAEKGERDAIDERLTELLHASQKSVWRRLESGASDSVLNPNRVVEEVVTHKRHVNERYVRTALLEEALLQRQENGEGEEENPESVNVGSSRTHPEPYRQPLDPFETVCVASPQAGSGHDARLSHSFPFAGDGGSSEFSGQINVSTLVQQAIDRGEGLRGIRKSTLSKNADGSVALANNNGSNEEEDDDNGEELPDDGLDRVPLDHLIAQAVQQQQQHGSAKRSRSGPTTPLPSSPANVTDHLQRNASGTTARLAAEDDDNGEDEVVVEDDEEGVVGGGGGGGGGGSGRGRMKKSIAATTTNSAATAAKKPRTTTTASGPGRQRGGGVHAAGRRATATAATASNAGVANASNSANGGGGPTLTLMAHQGALPTTTGRAGGGGRSDASSRPRPGQPQLGGPVAAASQGALLALLPKWIGSSHQQQQQ